MAPEHHRPLDVVLGRDLLERGAVGERLQAGEVALQPRDVRVAPAAVDDVVLAVGVLEHVLVDRLRAVPDHLDQRLAEQVVERALGPVRNSDADAAHLAVVVDVVGAEEEVVLAVLLHHRRRPHRLLRPA